MSAKTAVDRLFAPENFGEFTPEVRSRWEKIITEETAPKYRNPVPTVDIFIVTPPGLVLITRKNAPFGYALPGGFVNEGERFEDAAKREAIEETSLSDVQILSQFYTYTDRARDPRQHVTSTVYVASSNMYPSANDDAATVEVIHEDQLLEMLKTPEIFAFDHAKIISDVLAFTMTGIRPRLG